MIIFLYGEDTFRSRQKLNEFKNKFIREIDSSGNSIDIINGTKATIDEIGRVAGPGTLLAKKRMIIVEDLFSNKTPAIFQQVHSYLKSKKSVKDDNIIIFWDSKVKTKKFKNKATARLSDNLGRERVLTKAQAELFNFLLKHKYYQQFNFLNNTELISWIKKEVNNRDGKINNQAAQILASLIGNDLWQVNNEINKLLNYKLALQPKLTKAGTVAVEVEDVNNLVKGNLDENIFALTDAIGNKNKALAIKLLEEQITIGLTDGYLLNMIVRQFRILLQIRQALDSGLTSRKIINLLKLHPFVVQKGISQANQFSLTVLKNILNQLTGIDYSMKTGKIDILTMIDLLIARI